MQLVTLSRQLISKGILYTGSLAGEFLIFSASTMGFQFSRLAVSLAVARWVGPAQFGVWNALNLFLLYGVLITLGVPNGMNRDVPLLTGKGDLISAQRISSISFWFVLFLSSGFGVFVTLVALTDLLPEEYRWPLFWTGLLFFAHQMYQYFQICLKCNIRFHLMSLQQSIYAVLLPAVVLPLVRMWNVSGFILAQAIMAMILGLFIARIISFKIDLVWRWGDVISLIKIGFPIMAVGLLYSLLTSVDGWVVLTFLGVESLGHYSLAILCRGVLSLFPAVIAQQMYPRMAFRYGKTDDRHSLLPLIVRQSLIGAVVTLPILAFIYLTLPLLVDYFLPAYVPGLIPARILLVGLAFIPLGGGMGNFLNTVGKQVYYLAVQALAIGVNFGLDVLFVRMGYGLSGVALGAGVTYFIYAIILIGTGMYVYHAEL